jgi:pilus assembly protein CpaF
MRSLERSLERILPFVPPIEPLLRDEHVTEVMINGGGRSVFVERDGVVEQVHGLRLDEAHVRFALTQIARAAGREINELHPTLNTPLEGGARVAGAVPPVAIDGPTLTIRTFPRRYSLDEMVANGTLSNEHATYLRRAVETRRNVLIVGGTGTGKTTLLNALAALIPPTDRILLIEDTAEVHLTQPNVVRLQARQAQAPIGQEPAVLEVTIGDLVREALRHRPDRIFVSEIRGGEALQVLQACNTGHEGTMSTLHANSPEEALVRFGHCVLASHVRLPHRSIREAIGLAIHVIVHVAREGPSRKVIEIAALEGYNRRMDRFRLVRQCPSCA